MSSFNPYTTDPKPCWHCTRFLGLTAQGSAAVCGRLAASVAVVATPRRGCAFFEREVGVDEEPDWVPAPLTPAQAEALVAGRREPVARGSVGRAGAQVRLRIPEP